MKNYHNSLLCGFLADINIISFSNQNKFVKDCNKDKIARTIENKDLIGYIRYSLSIDEF